MSERTDRKLVEAYRSLVIRAMALVRKHGDYIGARPYSHKSDFDPADEEAVCLTIDGDVASLHFTAGGYDGSYSSSFDFEARALWDRKAIADAIKRRRRKRAEEQAAETARKDARDLAEYERLRRRFTSTDLRRDIARAIEIETRIAIEDGAALKETT